MSTAIEVLEFSRDLVKKGWTRGVWAEDAAEQFVDPEDPSACSFCLVGALKRARHVLKPTLQNSYYADIALRSALSNDFYNLIAFNDAQHSEEPVVDLFDRAIASLKEPA